MAQSVHGLYTLLLNKYYVDEIYAALIVRPLLWIFNQRTLARWWTKA